MTMVRGLLSILNNNVDSMAKVISADIKLQDGAKIVRILVDEKTISLNMDVDDEEDGDFQIESAR